MFLPRKLNKLKFPPLFRQFVSKPGRGTKILKSSPCVPEHRGEYAQSLLTPITVAPTKSTAASIDTDEILVYQNEDTTLSRYFGVAVVGQLWTTVLSGGYMLSIAPLPLNLMPSVFGFIGLSSMCV